MKTFKKKRVDLKSYYTLFLEIGLIITLTLFLVATKIEFKTAKKEMKLVDSQEQIVMEEIVNTEQKVKPPSVPRPAVPVAVPDNEIITDEIINIDAEINFDDELEIPPPPKKEEEKNVEPEDNFFVVVEQMPELKGGLSELHEHISYPKKATKAGIEGRVIIQFIITEKGEVENPQVIRGIGGGCDEEALRVVKEFAHFIPGKQRGVPVRVQYTLPIRFQLKSLSL